MNKTFNKIRSWLIRASGIARPSKWLTGYLHGNKTDSGIVMDTNQALSYAPVVQAITVLSGDIGQIPLDLYRRRDEQNKEKDRKNPLFKLAGSRANRYMSAATFRETMMLHVLLYGNGVAEIERNGRGQPVALWPLVPGRTSVEVINNVLWYKTRVGHEPNARDILLRPEDVIHISNFGSDGLWGYSTLHMARNSWGLGLAGEKYANKYFKHGGQPSGVIKYPEKLDESAYNRLKKSWKENHEGLDNAARVSILEEGAEYQAISFSQKDSQWLESRHFQREDVASWFNLPPHKLGVLHDANYSNMVEQNRGYLTTSLGRWESKWEDEYNEKLLTKAEQDVLFFEFNNDSLLKADIETRYSAYSTALGGHPFMEINEIRGKENMPEVEGGDKIPEPANMNPERDGAEGGKESDRTGTPNALQHGRIAPPNAVAVQQMNLEHLEAVREREKVTAAESSAKMVDALSLGMVSTQQAIENIAEAVGAIAKLHQPPAEDKLTGKISELLTCEANRVCHAARTAKNFVGWLDTFYDHWTDTLVNSVTGAPGCFVTDPLKVAAEWTEGHKVLCLDTAGRVTDKEQLSAAISAVTACWMQEQNWFSDKFRKKSERLES